MPFLLLQTPSAPPPHATPGLPQPRTFLPPQNAREANWLRGVRSELSDQLVSARNRRNTLANQYESATGANRAGLDQQLRVLDQRIAQLEQDIAESGRALTSGQTYSSTGTPAFFNLNSGQVTAISVVFTIFVLFPIALAAARSLWRRPARAALPPGWSDATQRLERLEQGMDTIAVEIERVSEGQRFITKIMTQGDRKEAAENAQADPAALNGGQPLPALGPGSPDQLLAQQQREEVRVRRG